MGGRADSDGEDDYQYYGGDDVDEDEEPDPADEEPDPADEIEFDDGDTSEVYHKDAKKTEASLRSSIRPAKLHIVAPGDRVTDNRLHKTEVARIIAIRAEQIALSAIYFTEADKEHDPVRIAYKELYERKCPLLLRRHVGTASNGENIVEEWDVRQMALPDVKL